jgi:hypothetical protein
MKNPDNPSGTSAGSPPFQPEETQSSSLQIVKPLTSEEKQRLAKLEKVIDAKLEDFFEVGSAIMEIKSKALFRETHTNFNAYCQDRWGFGRSYANKLIGSAERIQLLPQDLRKPANEFQIRPFLKLKPEEFAKRWPTIVSAAGSGKVTAKIVEDSLNLPKKRRKQRRAKTSDQNEGVSELLDSLRAALKEKNVDDALKHLAKLEKLLKP